MEKNTSITLGSYFEQFIKGLLKEGRYKNTSEVIRAGLRLLEEEEQKMLAFRKSNQIEGISLVSDDLNPYQAESKIETIEITSPFTQMTKKALNARVDQSESDFKKGRFKSSIELSEKYK